MPKTPLPKISVPLTEDAISALRVLSTKEGRSLASYVRRLIDMHLQRKGAK